MTTRSRRIDRVLSRTVDRHDSETAPPDGPRRLGPTLVDVSRLGLPADVSRALADAFWNHVGVRSEPTVRGYWRNLRTFARFVAETRAVSSLGDIDSVMVTRYLEWLNRQIGHKGTPLRAVTRSSAYYTLRTLLRWLQRCRPQLLGKIVFPQNVFPGKESSRRRLDPLGPDALRAILRACEADIAELRARRAHGRQEIERARTARESTFKTLGGLLDHIEAHCGGIAPPATALECRIRRASDALGGYRTIEPCLYPRPESLFPYFLAILIHAAGNPEAIAGLQMDCLQSVPLLDDRELLVWSKGRAARPQRRSFRTTEPFEPPALVRELIEWTQRLRPHLPSAHRNRLFVAKGHQGIRPFTETLLKKLRDPFIARHRLPPFTLTGLRSSVLTAFYRVSGDLRQAKDIANHAHLSTTVGYVRGPDVESQHRMRVAALQSAFLGHLGGSLTEVGQVDAAEVRQAPGAVPPGTAVSMFGFNCKDPFAGVAPGSRAGELCGHFLGCFTCPNAVITAEPASIARLLQARDHLRAGSTYLHPARWEAIYGPLLRILEEDILTRFSAGELLAATPLSVTLPPIPELQ
jgi:hypothetical protein